MKRLFLGLLLFVPFIALVFATNLYADPANLFNREYEQAAADILASGHNAANLSDMDDRTFIKLCLEQIDYPLDTLVLGSSRSIQLSRQVTGCENQFTAGVTGGDLRDAISFYLLADQLGKRPQRVIFVVEPWFLSQTGVNARARIDEYVEFAKEVGTTPITTRTSQWEKVKELFSLPYFQSSVAFLQAGKQNQRTPTATDEYWSETDMRRQDGSYCYNAAYREAGKQVVDSRVQDLIKVPLELLQKFDGMEPNCQAQLEAFLKRMQADGVEVVLMLAPFHPDYYAYMQQDAAFADVLQTETYYKQLAEQLGIRCFGSYNAQSLSLTGADFYDGLHPSEQALGKFFPQDLKG